MQQDIEYQRTQNQRLKDELAAKEQEKSGLMVDMRTQEESVAQNKKTSDELRKRLAALEDELAQTDAQYGEVLRQLKALTEEAETMAEKERVGEADKAGLKENIEKISGERNELVYRMNELAEKYEQFVRTLNQEREDIHRANCKHTKLLVAAGLFAHLRNIMLKRLALSMANIHQLVRYKKVVARRLLELVQFRELHTEGLVAKAFNRWRHGSLSWAQERRINEALLAKRLRNRLRTKYFLRWRTAYVRSSDKVDTQIQAVKRLRDLGNWVSLKRQREAFTRWARTGDRLHQRDYLLKRILDRLSRRRKEDALALWLGLSKKRSMESGLEELADQVAGEQFKRQMLARLRHNVYTQEDAKVGSAQVELDTKYAEKQRNRFLKAATILFMSLNRRKDKELRDEAFESVKFNRLAEMKERTRGELDKEVPACQELESTLGTEKQGHLDQRKERLLRAAFLCFRRRMRYYFEKWSNVPAVEADNLRVLKRVLSRWMNNKLATAFDLWYGKVLKTRLAQRKVAEKSAVEGIEHLEDTNKMLDQILEKQKTHMRTVTLSKLQRVAHMVARHLLRKRVATWRSGAITSRNVERGGNGLARLMRKHSLAQAVDRYREQTKKSIHAKGAQYKETGMGRLTERRLMRRTLRGLRTETHKTRLAKRVVAKMSQRNDHADLRKYVARWRTNAHNMIREAAKARNGELVQQIERVTTQIGEVTEKSKRAQEEQYGLSKKETRQAVAGIMKRFLLGRVQRVTDSFHRWRRIAKTRGGFQALMSRYLARWGKNNLWSALVNWRRNTFLTHVTEIKTELERKVQKFSTFSRMSAIKLGETEEEYKRLKETANQLRNEHELEENKVEKVTGILSRMKEYCIRYAFHSNFFLGWVDMYRRERMAQGKIKEATKMFVGKFIYATLKSAAAKRKTAVLVEKNWFRALNCLARVHSRRAVADWRESTRQSHKIAAEGEIAEQQAAADVLTQNLDFLHERATDTYEHEIVRRRRLRTFRGWQKQAATQRLLMRKTEQISGTLKLMRLENSFGRWRADVRMIEAAGEGARKAGIHRSARLLRSAARGWRQTYWSESRLAKVLHKLSTRQYMNNLTEAYERLIAYNKGSLQSIVETRVNAASMLATLLERVRRVSLARTVSQLQERSKRRHMGKDLLRRVVIKRFNRRVNDALARWLEKAQELRLVDEVESRGHTASEVSQVLRTHSSIRKLIQKEGLEKSYMEASAAASPIRLVSMSTGGIGKLQGDFTKKAGLTGELSGPHEGSSVFPRASGEPSPLSRKEFSGFSRVSSAGMRTSKLASQSRLSEHKLYLDEKRELAAKFVTKWMRLSAGRDALGRCIDSWRKWMYTRKEAERFATFVLKRLRFGEKAWAFDRWRNMKRSVIRSCENVDRSSIVNRIVGNSRDITVLENAAENLESSINEHQKHNRVMAEGYDKGKRLAAGVLMKLMQAALLKRIRRWRKAAQQDTVDVLERTLREKMEAFQRLQEINSTLEDKNKSLMVEAEDLRQTSLDGLEIANVKAGEMRTS